MKLFDDQGRKPKFRGRIHRFALYLSICLGLFFFILARSATKKLAVVVYFLSQILMYTVSSVYHITIWSNPKNLTTMQKIDRSSIFMLISGTQTAFILLMMPLDQFWPYFFLGSTWTLSFFGFLKTFFWENAPEFVNIGSYIIHGASVIFIIPMMINNMTIVTVIGLFFGGFFYISGGIIFGLEKPDPIPLVFGFHEVFHTLTLLGNLSFMIPIGIAILK